MPKAKMTKGKSGHCYFEPDELIQKAQEYLAKRTKKKPMAMMIDFQDYLGVNSDYILELPDRYSGARKKVNELFEVHNANLVGRGETPTAWMIFYMKNKHGYKDQQHIDQTNTTVNRVLNDEQPVD